MNCYIKRHFRTAGKLVWFIQGFILFSSFTVASCQEHALNEKATVNTDKAGKTPVVLNNKAGIIPLKELKDLQIASVHFNFTHATVFDSIAGKYWPVTGFNADTIKTDDAFYALHDKLKLYNPVLVELSEKT